VLPVEKRCAWWLAACAEEEAEEAVRCAGVKPKDEEDALDGADDATDDVESRDRVVLLLRSEGLEEEPYAAAPPPAPVLLLPPAALSAVPLPWLAAGTTALLFRFRPRFALRRVMWPLKSRRETRAWRSDARPPVKSVFRERSE
jgi:hypothetical protein